MTQNQSTNTSQRPPEEKCRAIQGFHRRIQVAVTEDGEQAVDIGKFRLQYIANVDQTPLPFCSTDGEMYSDTGDKTVLVRGPSSELEKRQCTVQVTLFADGVPRVNLAYGDFFVEKERESLLERRYI